MSAVAPALSASPTILSARDRMRLLKETLVREEQVEAQARREQSRESRRSRRESAASASSLLDVPRAGSPSSSIRSMSVSGSTGAASPTGSIRSVRPILKSSLSASPSYSPRLIRSDSVQSDTYTDFSPSSASRYQIRRRSSRVRFSENPIPLGSSSATVPEDKRKSSLESLQEDLALAKRNMGMNTRPSVASAMSDQFDLSASPVQQEPTADFSPLPLRYPSVGRLPSRLSVETLPSSDGQSRRSSAYGAPTLPLPPPPTTSASMPLCPPRRRPSYAPSTESTTGDAIRKLSASPSITSSIDGPEEGLRDLIKRSSIPDTPAEVHNHARPSYAPSVLSPSPTPLPRLSRLSSTGQTWASQALSRPSFGSLASSLDIPSVSSSFSVGPLDRSTARPTPGPVPYANRQDWEQWSDEQGLSPKATASPWAEGLLRASEAAVQKRAGKESGRLPKFDFPVPPSRTSEPDLAVSTSGLGLELERIPSTVVDVISPTTLSTPPKPREIELGSPDPSAYSPASDILLTPSGDRSSSPPLDSMRKAGKQSRLLLTRSDDEGDDSDLDIVTPLARLAVKNRIISSSSSLLRPVERRPLPPRRVSKRSSTLSLRTGSCLTADKGWSGSESEEEEFVATMRDIARRRSSAAVSVVRTARSASEDSSGSAGSSADQSAGPRLSQSSEPSSATSATSLDSAGSSTEPLTPPVVKEKLRLAKPGDFPWGSAANSPTGSGPSTPLPSPVGHSVQPVLSALLRKMPPPQIEVDGWGPPEVLHDDVEAYFPRGMAASPAPTESDATTISTSCSTPVHSTPKLSMLISPETPTPESADYLPGDAESGSPLSQLVLKAAAQSPTARVVYRKSLSPRNARFDHMPYI